MNLSKHVLPLAIDSKLHYFETIHQKTLPADSDEELLRSHFFLAGQEEESIHNKLFAKFPYLKLTIIPTWECNLRCAHCCVSDKLVKKEPTELNVDKLKDFLIRYFEKYKIERSQIIFCGGEPLLRSNLINKVVSTIRDCNFESEIHFTVTTNLSKELTDEDILALSSMNGIAVSIDGPEKEHNEQRKGPGNPYQQTLSNIKKLILKGFRDKITIQSTIGFSSVDVQKEFVKEMLRYGIHKKAIGIGAMHPTRDNSNVSGDYVNFMKNYSTVVLWYRQCCKYQHMSNFLVDSTNKIYTDFYIQDYLGTLDDEIELISDKFRQSILREMPVLHDQNCRNCPVLGLCWGRCCQANVCNKKPSELCNMNGVIETFYKKNKEIVKYIS